MPTAQDGRGQSYTFPPTFASQGYGASYGAGSVSEPSLQSAGVCAHRPEGNGPLSELMLKLNSARLGLSAPRLLGREPVKSLPSQNAARGHTYTHTHTHTSTPDTHSCTHESKHVRTYNKTSCSSHAISRWNNDRTLHSHHAPSIRFGMDPNTSGKVPFSAQKLQSNVCSLGHVVMRGTVPLIGFRSSFNIRSCLRKQQGYTICRRCK